MNVWGRIPALLSLVGAGLAYFGASAGTGQRENQGRRLLFADTRYNPGNADLRIVDGEQELDRRPFIEDDEVDDRTGGPL